MPRIELSPDCDLGFLHLRPDGSVKANFRIDYFYLSTDCGDLEGNLRNSEFVIILNGSKQAIPVELTDDDWKLWLPKEAGCFVFPKELKAALAKNTNTGLQILRNDSATLLQTWRSRKERFFVYYNGTWLETDGPDACTFMQYSPDNADADGNHF